MPYVGFGYIDGGCYLGAGFAVKAKSQNCAPWFAKGVDGSCQLRQLFRVVVLAVVGNGVGDVVQGNVCCCRAASQNVQTAVAYSATGVGGAAHCGVKALVPLPQLFHHLLHGVGSVVAKYAACHGEHGSVGRQNCGLKFGCCHCFICLFGINTNCVAICDTNFAKKIIRH